MTTNNDKRTSSAPAPAASNQASESDLKRTERGGQQGGYHPEDHEGAAKATADNDLTTGHSEPDDGGADNAKR